MLKISGVEVRYGPIAAVRQASLEVAQGELVVLVGANGAGKTTLLRAVSGLHDYTGLVEFDGRDLRGLPAEKRVRAGLCHVPEGRRVFARMTVTENLQTATWASGKSFKQEADYVLDLFPILKTRGRQMAGTLSGGEQQMLALARALIRHPSMLLLDEPSMGLAPIVVGQIFDLIAEVHSRGTSVLLVEQNATRALQIADRAYVMEHGETSGGGSAAEFLDSTDLQAKYLGKRSS
ncbi:MULTISPECIES: ABC transporter ATP-binding protein [unclassified Mycolicibacterium]|jgi:branched-chain amino acid transport system ATP-binding protein|uniref:ABC transporter ATP-binding protein n=1 Tax=unclassified Mycolicibacterium TaxID=2636767 RepID=UPI001F4C30B7|nr:ABC transporter ATP-binding protein [Mycolicibacterium sp. YH-1]UNB51578.1 ABC transporter ATP-binding protein [Mycolicibacterium sp. YH-1]